MADLYEELKQLCPAVEAEDYSKGGGAWILDLLRLDLDLVRKHRKEAGAPEIEIVRKNGLKSATRTEDRPPISRTVARPPVSKAALGAPPPSSSSLVPSRNPSTSDQVREIQDFVQRWTLDSSGAKLLLARLKPHQRRYVLENFSSTSSDRGDATNDLKQYIQEADQDLTWGPDPSTSTKRPSSTVESAIIGGDQKRPRTAVPSSKASSPVASSISTKPKSPSPSASVAPRPKSGEVTPSVGGIVKSKAGGSSSALTPTRPKSSPPPEPSTEGGRPGDLIRSLLQI